MPHRPSSSPSHRPDPTDRPVGLRSRDARVEGHGLAVGAGLVVALLACSSTWLYLSSIEIDDGLEGLVFLPILLGAGFLVGPVLGWLRTNPVQPFLCAAVASVAIGITLAAWRSTRPGGSSIIEITVMTVVVFFPLALTGATLGWAAGIALRRLRFPTRI